MNTFVARWFRNLDWTLITTVMLLSVYSCVALFSTTYGKTGRSIPPHILEKQILFELIGLFAMLLTAKMDYRELRKYSLWMYGISILLLIVVFGMPKKLGAHSWIPLGAFAFQPSEFAKLVLIIAAGAVMANHDESGLQKYGWKTLLFLLTLFLLPFGFTLKEPALGQALIMLPIIFFMFMLFMRRSHFTIVLIVAGLVVGGFVFVSIMFPGEIALFLQNFISKHHLLQGYQADRIAVWLNPNYQVYKAGFNVHQAQMAIGSGQIFGEGFLHGVETSGNWIPNQWDDYIFTAIAEQFGFVGSAVLILLFLLLLYRLVKISIASMDMFGTYCSIGIAGMLGFQVFENIGADMYLSPSTGIVLPFISAGGSAIIMNYITIGLALSIYRKSRAMRFIVASAPHSVHM